MTTTAEDVEAPRRKDNYKWVALSNTTVGIMLATIDSSILLIAMPDIFRGIRLDPLAFVQHLLPAVDDPRLPHREQRAGRQPGTARGHQGPGPHVQPRIRHLHRRL